VSSVVPSPLAGGGRSCSACGRSLRLRRPNTWRNFRVVPYSTGRPSESSRPAMRSSPFSISCRNTSLHCTPRIVSTSARVIGCRYATMASVSRAAGVSRTSLPDCRSRSSHGWNSGRVKSW
jgi:hypothetical protein